MLKRLYDTDFPLHISLLLLCGLPVVISFLLTTDGHQTFFRFPFIFDTFGLPCIFKITTGYNCPACGMTRSFTYMSSFQPYSAWMLSRSGTLLYIFCIFQSLYRLMLLFNLPIPRRNLFVKAGITFLIFIGALNIFDFAKQFI